MALSKSSFVLSYPSLCVYHQYKLMIHNVVFDVVSNLRLSFEPAGFVSMLMLSLYFQLAEAWQEAEVARGRSQQLQAQVEELQEEVSLQEARSHGDASLLSELESSLETAGLGVSKAEVLKMITETPCH